MRFSTGLLTGIRKSVSKGFIAFSIFATESMVIKQLSQRCSFHFSTIFVGKRWFNFLYDMETTSLVRFLLSFLPFVVHSWNNPFFTLSHYFAYFAFHVCGWSVGFCLDLNPVALRWKLMSCFPNVFSKFTPPYFISNL